MKTGTYGWKSVFAFTFRQTAKSKAFKVSSVIIIVLVFAIALLAGVLPALIGSRSTSDDGDITGDGETLVGTVYFADTTGITTGKDYEGFLSGLGVKSMIAARTQIFSRLPKGLRVKTSPCL